MISSCSVWDFFGRNAYVFWSHRTHTARYTQEYWRSIWVFFPDIFQQPCAHCYSNHTSHRISYAPKASTIDILYLAISHPTALLCIAEQYVWTEKRGHSRANRELFSSMASAGPGSMSLWKQTLTQPGTLRITMGGGLGHICPSDWPTSHTLHLLLPGSILRASSLTHYNNQFNVKHIL